ncbi:substrate-binding periplasmic protein [Reinekea blandensis]|uniref:ABC-type amino acid transport/signal transduction systems, periplasmic component/domain n=1 Tax=Reinekea blandensis MED297 TaxID=314283 RepID=A4BCT3_9GAMM|nr:transporter substrate-binding domain-containing protein [Reinekea blandensis]EAR10015.1 ABC-type amino acid transport/signal transduction systems, periplasmic component/domain [Reinekea sp. MED297] [Reinekea blandensis MED297]
MHAASWTKRLRSVLLSCGSLLFTGWLSLAALAQAETVHLASGEWPPYTSESLPNGGPSTELVRKAFAEVGMDVEIDYFPWARSYEYVVNDHYDGSFTWQQTPKRLQEVLFSDPVLQHHFMLFHHKTLDLTWTDVSDLKPYLIAQVAGYSYGERFDDAVEQNQLMTTIVDFDIYALRMLAAQRVQLFPSEVNVAYWLMRNELEPQQSQILTHDPRPIHEETTAVIFNMSDRGRELQALFNQGLQRLKASGDYTEILTDAGMATGIVP